MMDEITQRDIFHIEIKFSDRPIKAKNCSPITLPKTGNNKATTKTTTTHSVKPIAIILATIKDRFSSTRYARLNDFVIAFIPFDADQIVPIIPIDNNPPLRLLTRCVKLESII